MHFPEYELSNEPKIKKVNGVAVITSWQYMENAYKDISAISIDIAVAEHTKKACAVLASFTWHDIGSWENFAALFDTGTADEKSLQVQTSNCFIYSDIPTVLCGV